MTVTEMVILSSKGVKAMNGSYVQLTVKFPTGKERYRQALECITTRDKGQYPTLADYVTAAVLFFEGNLADERNALSQIMVAVNEINEKADEILNGQKENT